MKQAELLTLMESFVQSGLHRMEYEAEGARLVLERNAPGAPAAGIAAQPSFAFVQEGPACAADAQPVHQPAAQTPPATMSAEGPMKGETNSAAQGDLQTVKAPLVGVFYRSASPEEAPFVKEGDTVEKGQVLCLIEAMKMMNELNSPARGVVKRILAENEAVVSFGQALFEVVPC